MSIKDITNSSRVMLPYFREQEQIALAEGNTKESEALSKAVEVCMILSAFDFSKPRKEIVTLKRALVSVNQLKNSPNDLIANYAYGAFFEISKVLHDNKLAAKQYRKSNRIVNKNYDKAKRLENIQMNKTMDKPKVLKIGQIADKRGN